MGFLISAILGCTRANDIDSCEAFFDENSEFSESLDAFQSAPTSAPSNEILVTMHNGGPPPPDLLQNNGYQIAKKIESSSIYLLQHKSNANGEVLISSENFKSTQASIDLFDKDPRVKAASPNHFNTPHLRSVKLKSCEAIADGNCPNDPEADEQWHLRGVFSSKDILRRQYCNIGANVEAAWAYTRGDAKTPIVIVDVASDAFLEAWNDLEGFSPRCKTRVLSYEPYGPPVASNRKNHGYAVTTVAGTCTDNNLSLSAPNWYAPVTLYSTALSVSSTLGAIQKALAEDPNSIINSSYGGPFARFSFDVAEQNRNLPFVWVASAGNDGKTADFSSPAAIPRVISVGATNRLGKRADFSSYGKSVDIFAPGTEIMVRTADYYRKEDEGTSFSAPLVSSIISLVKAVYPADDPWNWQIAKYLIHSCYAPREDISLGNC